MHQGTLSVYLASAGFASQLRERFKETDTASRLEHIAAPQGAAIRIDNGIVVVVYTEREENVIRIIGARFANKREQELFRSHMDMYR